MSVDSDYFVAQLAAVTFCGGSLLLFLSISKPLNPAQDAGGGIAKTSSDVFVSVRRSAEMQMQRGKSL